MKNTIILLAMLIVSSTSFGYANDIQNIKGREVLKVAIYSGNASPFLYRSEENGAKPKGLDIELLNLISQELGVKVEIDASSKTFDEIVDKVNEKKVDIGLSNLSITPKRAQKVNFTQAYVNLKIGLVFNRVNYLKLKNSSEKPFQSKKAIAGVMKGSSFIDYIKNRYPNAKIKSFDSFGEVYKALAAGKIDFTLTDEARIRSWRFDFPSLNLKTNVQMLNDVIDPIGIAVAWDSPQLTRWLNIFFRSLQNSGKLNQISHRYFSNDLWRSE